MRRHTKRSSLNKTRCRQQGLTDCPASLNALPLGASSPLAHPSFTVHTTHQHTLLVSLPLRVGVNAEVLPLQSWEQSTLNTRGSTSTHLGTIQLSTQGAAGCSPAPYSNVTPASPQLTVLEHLQATHTAAHQHTAAAEVQLAESTGVGLLVKSSLSQCLLA